MKTSEGDGSGPLDYRESREISDNLMAQRVAKEIYQIEDQEGQMLLLREEIREIAEMAGYITFDVAGLEL